MGDAVATYEPEVVCATSAYSSLSWFLRSYSPLLIGAISRMTMCIGLNGYIRFPGTHFPNIRGKDLGLPLTCTRLIPRPVRS